MADSGTYDQATITRRQKLAEQMLAESSKPQKIEHWAQGLAQLGNVGVDAYQLNRLDKQAGEARKQDTAALMTLLGGGAPAAASPAAAPAATPAPSPSMPAPSPQVLGMGGKPETPDAQGAYSADAVMMPPAPAPSSASAIAGIESGGKYDALGPVIPKSGDRAYGKYQVMGANVPEWTRTHLGREMTPQEFLASPEAQDAVFKGQFGGYEKKYGPEGAARAWFAGEGGMNDMGRRDPLGTSVADYSKKFTAGMGPQAAIAQAMTPGGSAAFSGEPQPATGGASAVAQAMTPQPTANAPAPAAASAGGLLGNVPASQRAAVIAGMSASPDSPARALATSILTNSIKGTEKTNDIKEYERVNAERTAKGLPPMGLLEYQKELKTAGKPETTINNTVNPILHGVGERFNEGMAAATASVPQIQGIHEARKALDQGAITGVGADPKLLGAKIANMFGIGTDKAENTEVLRSSIGNSVLAKAKTLGANPSNADRDYIEKVVGGSIALEEASVRRLLDMQEKWARDAIKRANAQGQKLLASKPKELADVSGLLSVEEPGSYEDFLKANPIVKGGAPAAGVPAGAKVRKFNPATGKIE